MRTLTVIPSRYEPDRLEALRLTLGGDGDVVVLDNGHTPPLADAHDTRGLGIYAMWNYGWRLAREGGYDAVALLNDDVRLLPGTINLMAIALAHRQSVGVVYPDWPQPLRSGLPRRAVLQPTIGTVKDEGMTGFCFMFRTDLPVPPFDEGFGWWCGDDAFERSVRDAGFEVCRIVGVPCEHESDSERDDWARRPELRAIADADMARWAAMQ